MELLEMSGTLQTCIAQAFTLIWFGFNNIVVLENGVRVFRYIVYRLMLRPSLNYIQDNLAQLIFIDCSHIHTFVMSGTDQPTATWYTGKFSEWDICCIVNGRAIYHHSKECHQPQSCYHSSVLIFIWHKLKSLAYQHQQYQTVRLSRLFELIPVNATP